MSVTEDQGALDDSPLRSPRFRWALALFVLSYGLGWPVVGVAAGASPWIGVENAAMVGSGSYALSWAVFGVSILLGGREIVTHGRAWMRRGSSS